MAGRPRTPNGSATPRSTSGRRRRRTRPSDAPPVSSRGPTHRAAPPPFLLRGGPVDGWSPSALGPPSSTGTSRPRPGSGCQGEVDCAPDGRPDPGGRLSCSDSLAIMERIRNSRKYPARGAISENDNQVRENSDSHGIHDGHHSDTAGLPSVIVGLCADGHPFVHLLVDGDLEQHRHRFHV